MRCLGPLALAASIVLASVAPASSGLIFTTPVNLGPTINGPFDETSPNISSDGLTLFFASNRPTGEGNKFDIFQATRPTVNDPFGTPTPINEINSPFSDFAPSISHDGLTLFFKSTRDDPAAQGNLWFATRPSTDAPFSAPQRVANVNSSIDDGAPSISSDGLTLFLASLRSGGFGSYDIWQATRPTINDEFGVPTNLGATVNSSFNDGTPSISVDGLTLFFASKRPGGFGPRSLWMTTRPSTSQAFGTPTNLGPVVNSDFMDVAPSISADFRTLFFVSDRPGGEGGSDIWMTTVVPEPSSILLFSLGIITVLTYAWCCRPLAM